MQKICLFGIWAILIVIIHSTNTSAQDKIAVQKRMLTPEYALSGPYHYENLTVFLIHGQDKINDHEYLTLDEALEKKLAFVHETEDVNQLSIENKSDKHHIFIQSGDIVKGGKQDRTLSMDMIIPPKSKKIPLEAFCVEQGRWKSRGDEPAKHFSSSKNRLSTKALKLAAKLDNSQESVWEEVGKTQQTLGQKLNKSVRNSRSATSLQLSLEDKDVKNQSKEYLKKLLPSANNFKDVVGYAFAINGEFNSADIYGSSHLFKKLWPKLLKASSVEAIALFEKDKSYKSAVLEDVKAHIQEAFKGKKSKQKTNKDITIMTKESKQNYLFESKNKAEQMLHMNVIKK